LADRVDIVTTHTYRLTYWEVE